MRTVCLAVVLLMCVAAVAQQQVDVVNGKAHPVPTLEATQPYEDTCTTGFGGQTRASCPLHSIPSGKRLVIQEYDSSVNIEQGLRPGDVILETSGSVGHYFTATFMGTSVGYSTYATHQETRLYVAPGFQPICLVLVTSYSHGTTRCQISGFLVDIP